MVHTQKLIFCIIAIFLTCSAYGQIKPNHAKQLKEKYQTDESLRAFVNKNKFDYVLLAWTSWISFGSSYSGLVKKKAKWYLAQINYRTVYPDKGFKIKQKRLLQKQVDSLLLDLKPDSAFLFTRKDMTTVLVNCRYGILDGGGMSLAQFSNGEVKIFGMDAPEFYLEKCYPAYPELERLKGFIKTYAKLTAAANAIK